MLVVALVVAVVSTSDNNARAFRTTVVWAVCHAIVACGLGARTIVTNTKAQ